MELFDLNKKIAIVTGGNRGIGFAVAGAGSGLIMALVGFVPDAPVQPEGAVTGMRIAYILVPVVGALLAIWVMRDYDVTEERAKEIRAELERRRGKTLLA